MTEGQFYTATQLAFALAVAIVLTQLIALAMDRLRGRFNVAPKSVQWQILRRVSWLPLFAIAIALSYGLAAGNLYGMVEILVSPILLLGKALFAFFALLPVAPIVYVWRKPNLRFPDYALFFICVAALPFVCISLVDFTAAQKENPGRIWQVSAPTHESVCERAAADVTTRLGGRPMALFDFRTWRTARDIDTIAEFKTANIQFWFDNALRASLFDVPEIFGCNISLLRLEQSEWDLALMLFGYRMFITNIVLAVVFVMLRRAIAPAMKTNVLHRILDNTKVKAVIDRLWPERRRRVRLWLVREKDDFAVQIKITAARDGAVVYEDDRLLGGIDRMLQLREGEYDVAIHFPRILFDDLRVEQRYVLTERTSMLIVGLEIGLFRPIAISARLLTTGDTPPNSPQPAGHESPNRQDVAEPLSEPA